MDQPTAAPTEKVTAALVAGAFVVLLTYILKAAAGVELPVEVQSAVTVLVMGGAAYLKREGAGRHVAGV